MKSSFDSVGSVSDLCSMSCVLVIGSRVARSKMSGVVWRFDWEKLSDKGVKVYEYMMSFLDSVLASWDFEQGVFGCKEA